MQLGGNKMSLSVNIKKKIEGFTLDVAFEAENEFLLFLGKAVVEKV